MPESLRGGVIGAGVFGGYHARQYARIEGVALSAVFDPHPQRAAEVAMPLGGRAFHDLEAFLDAVDVVTVASPATVHGDQALAVLRAGKPVYVEKPIAVTLADAAADAATAGRGGRQRLLACGHQERVIFQRHGPAGHPRTAAAAGGGAPWHCRRRAAQDVSAVLDLMIHDLDLALSI
jgi:predicted dehydrogenase